VVVSDLVERTDTGAFAHVLLPAAAWGEKDGTVTNSERRISRQRAFLSAPGEAKPDWWIVTQVARRLGFERAFPYETPHAIFREHARLSAWRNGPAGAAGDTVFRDFNLAGLAELSEQDYDALEPLQWPVLPGRPGTSRLFADGRFFHADGRARLVPLAARAPANAPDDEYPLVLNTGRVRDQWHTMTRTGRAPRLATHAPEPYVEIHPHDAIRYGVRDGRLARVATRWGRCVVRARATADVARGQIFVPIHWSDATASDARVGALVNPAMDPISGEPEFKHTPARVEPFEVDWYGFAIARREIGRTSLDALTWWVRIQGEGCARYELAGRGTPPDWRAFARGLIGAGDGGEDDWIEASDLSEGMYRTARVANGRIEGCVFVAARAEDLPPRSWLAVLFAQERLEALDRISLLAGQPARAEADTGPTVCSCFGVGRAAIARAVLERGLRTVQALGEALRCGTGCGSCVPELHRLLAASREPA
jgi:assimilatory nitrate reductase catalytic subunit